MPSNSKPSQNGHTLSAQPSHYEALAKARKAVAEALKLNPVMPALQLAEVLKTSGGEFVADLKDILLSGFYVHEIRAARLKQAAANRAQFLLPGFEHLPLRIPGPQGKPIPLGEASYTRVRAYYRSLTTGHDARKRNDPRVREAKALMEKMRKRSRRDKGITVREVVLLDQ